MDTRLEEALKLLDSLEARGVAVSFTEDGRPQVRPACGLLPGQLGALGRLRAEVRALLPHPEEGLVRSWLEPLPPLEERSLGCANRNTEGGQRVSRTRYLPLRRQAS